MGPASVSSVPLGALCVLAGPDEGPERVKREAGQCEPLRWTKSVSGKPGDTGGLPARAPGTWQTSDASGMTFPGAA